MGGFFRRGGVWWARLVVPARLRAAAGRREFVRSTGTCEFALGKMVAAALLAGWRKDLMELEHGQLNDEKLLRLMDGSPSLAGLGFISLERAQVLAGLDVADLLRESVAGCLSLGCRVGREHGPGYVMDSFEASPAGPRGGLEVPTQPPAGAYAVDMAAQVLRLTDGGVDVAEAVLADGLNEVTLVVLQADWGSIRRVFVPDQPIRLRVAHLEVRVSDVETLRRTRAATVGAERVERARTALTTKVEAEGAGAGKWASWLFSRAVDEYCSVPFGLPDTLSSVAERRHRRAGLHLLCEFMGDRMLATIDGDVLRAFRDGPLSSMPGKVNALPKDIKRSTMTATMAALREDGRPWPVMSRDMQHERMKWLYRFFGWLKSKDYLGHDPASSLRGESGLSKSERVELNRAPMKVGKARVGFTPDQLALIFGQSQYKSGNGAHVVKGNQAWRPFEYWLPLLALYAGLRIKEASQLHLDDLSEIDGLAILDINMNTADKSLKTDESKRQIPLHPELMRLGLLEYVQRLRSAGYKRLFPELTLSSSDAKYAKEPIRVMSRMLADLGMPRNGLLVFHSFRHNTNESLRRVDVAKIKDADENLKAFIRYKVMGHVPGTDANVKHYSGTTIGEMTALVAGMNYVFLPVIAPFDIEAGVASVALALARKQGQRHGVEDMGAARKRAA